MSKESEEQYHLDLSDPTQLKKYYMPFIKNGGVFIVTKADHAMGKTLRITLKIPGNPESFTLSGKVVWINPPFTQNNREEGVGIRFESENALQLKEKIEKCLLDLDGKSVTSATL